MNDYNENLEPSASEMAVKFAVQLYTTNNVETVFSSICDLMLADAKKIHDFLIGKSHHFKENKSEGSNNTYIGIKNENYTKDIVKIPFPFSRKDIEYMSIAMQHALDKKANNGAILWRTENGNPYFVGVNTD